jgi:oligo-1,6-glucosidase
MKWWKDAIIYQVYPLSFKDSNHDGIGDLKGITQKLDYIKDLGVDVIWLSPVYETPLDDNGYDISDYKKIDPIFGTMDDMIQLINEVHRKNMKIIMDLVVNHTSDMHHWFLDAKSSKNSKYRDYYIFSEEINDIGSVFGGPAWTYNKETSDYYFHLFSKRQPDLNWQNKNLRDEIYSMINWWLDLGIDGFRLDVIDLIGKDVSKKILSDGPYLEKHLKELYETCFKNRDIMTVGEMPGLSIKRASEITDENTGYLNMIFQFSHISLDEMPHQGKWALKKLDLKEFKQNFIHVHEVLSHKGWNSLFLANHDQPRVVTRFGSETYRVESAKMIATFLYFMQGTPYIFQGEEIGMTGVKFDISQYMDLETINIYEILKNKGLSHDKIMQSIYMKSRDNSRTPFQWNDTEFAGFSTHKPWLDVNPNYKIVNAEKDLKDENGVFNYFKKLIKIRKSFDVFNNGKFNMFDISNMNIVIYERVNENDKFLIIASFSDQEVSIDIPYHNYEVMLTNYVNFDLKTKNKIPPYFCSLLKIKENQNANN